MVDGGYGGVIDHRKGFFSRVDLATICFLQNETRAAREEIM